METIADELKDSGVPEENIIYLNLDKRESRKIKSADDHEKLIESSIKNDKLNYIFIDEGQRRILVINYISSNLKAAGNFSFLAAFCRVLIK